MATMTKQIPWGSVTLNEYRRNHLLHAALEPLVQLKQLESEKLKAALTAIILADVAEHRETLQKVPLNYLARDNFYRECQLRIALTDKQQAENKGKKFFTMRLAKQDVNKNVKAEFWPLELTVKSTTPLGREAVRAFRACESANTTYQALYNELRPLLRRTRNCKQLLELWPDALQYIPKEWYVKTGKAVVPANVAAIDQALQAARNELRKHQKEAQS